MNETPGLLNRLKVFIGQNFLEPYCCFFSRVYLRRWRPTVIVITGSVGKTNLLYLLKEQFGSEAAYSYRANTKTGITFSVLGLPAAAERWRWPLLIAAVPFAAFFKRVREEKFYLVEYDVSETAAARYFKWWLNPAICLWTTVSESHLQAFDRAARKQGREPFELVVEDFAKVVRAASERIFAPGSSRLMRNSLKGTDAPISWSDGELLSYEVGPKGTVFKFPGREFVFSQPLPRQLADSLALMTDLLKHCGREVKTDCRDWPAPPGRSTLLAGYKGCWLIDSSYNAQLEAVAAVLEMFKEFSAAKKWLVIGDMTEQGSFVERAHRDLAELIIDFKPDRLFLVGRRLKQYACPLLEKRYPDLHWSPRADAALIKLLKDSVTGEEAILFKGAGFLDILVEALLKNQADAALLNNPGRLRRVLRP